MKKTASPRTTALEPVGQLVAQLFGNGQPIVRNLDFYRKIEEEFLANHHLSAWRGKPAPPRRTERKRPRQTGARRTA